MAWNYRRKLALNESGFVSVTQILSSMGGLPRAGRVVLQIQPSVLLGCIHSRSERDAVEEIAAKSKLPSSRHFTDECGCCFLEARCFFCHIP